jgi:Tat protein translocase TatB subunit
MLPFGIGFSEIVIILLVLIIFVGPDGIPQAVRAIAKVIRTVRSMVDEVRYSEEFNEVKREILQPLDEARRFNPKRRAEAWVKRELEDPVRSFTHDHVEDFKTALDEDQSQGAHAAASGDSLESSIEREQHVHSESSQGHQHMVEESPENAPQEWIGHGDEDDHECDEDEHDLGPIATTDPLDRGVIKEDESESVEALSSTPEAEKGES